jgi:predicted ATPase/DNA-binding SARP family transcriptional activator
MRSLFGLLALRAPAVVSQEALVDGLWDADPPPAAKQTLRATMAHLRRQLADSGCNSSITTRAPGYVLNVPAEQIDVTRFEAGVRQAQGAGAGTRLQAALSLWRGEVLADCVIGGWARAEATRLHELRHSATEELLAARLAAGEQAAVIAELESLVARYPLRERLWELLMQALAQAGRRGDALSAYQRARSRLVDELGVEPGAGLRHWETTVLSGQSTWHYAPVMVPPELPSPLTALIGRSADLAEVRELIQEHRLVTLTGAGGCGKTRLAVAVAHEATAFPQGVWFIDLAPVTEPGQVPATVATVFGVSADSPTALAESLRAARCLLILDNCEHLLDACAALTASLLRSCPSVRVLATSREALGLPGEISFGVLPLAVPPAGADSLVQARRYDAVRLLLERSAPQATRHLTDADAPALAAICGAVDGLPLALELAAARTTVLSITQIASRLNDPDLLPVRRYAEHPRHRALDASIGWSYDLLEAQAQQRFRQLSVFAGGFTLASAEAVWQDRQNTVDLMSSLVAKSLVVAEHQPAGTRFRLLETIRRWAMDRLALHPQEQRLAQARHAAHFAAEVSSTEQGSLDRLTAEHENLRTAMAWHAGEQDPLPQLHFALALAPYCQSQGRYRQGLLWIQDAMARQRRKAGIGQATLGAALACEASFAFLLGDYREAQTRARRALRINQEYGNHPETSRTLRLLSSVARERGDYAGSMRYLDEASTVPGTAAHAARALVKLRGFTALLSNDLTQAQRLLEEALRQYLDADDDENAASARLHLAAVAYYQGRFDQARELAGGALACFSKMDAKDGIAWALNLLGLVQLGQGQISGAIGTLRASLHLHLTLGDRWRQASVLDALAAALLERGEPVTAAELLDLAASLRQAVGVPVPAIERDARQRTHRAVQARLSKSDKHSLGTHKTSTTIVEVLAKFS